MSNFTNTSFPSSPSCVVGLYLLLTSTILSTVLLLPLCLFVLYLGFQRWRRRRSVPSAVASRNLSDAIAYNIAVMELMGVLGCICMVCSLVQPVMLMVAIYITAFVWYGQMLLPLLTCVELYLAVVHPLTYVRLRQAGGLRIRNASIASIWLLGFVGVVLCHFTVDRPIFLHIQCILELVVILVVMAFFSLSILWALTRPRPGEAAGDGAPVHQSKRSALRTIAIIMVALLLRFSGNLVTSLVNSSPVSLDAACVVRSLVGWFNLPSALVLPLLFLHRVGKLPSWTHGTGSR